MTSLTEEPFNFDESAPLTKLNQVLFQGVPIASCACQAGVYFSTRWKEMEHSTEDFKRPDAPEWDAFEDAAVKLYQDWDIIQHALQDEWAGGLTEEYVDRVLDFLLENFAERWLEGRGTKMDAVADFLSDTMQDHFEVEISHVVALPLAKVLTTLHEECRNGVLTGVNHVLGKERVEQVLRRAEEPRDDVDVAKLAEMSLASQSKESGDKSLKQADVAGVESTEVAKDQAQEAVSAVPGSETSATQQEDDGWTTVSSKKKGKKKGKQFD